MAYFPFYIDINNKIFLVVGGGKIALGKIKVLLKFEAIIIVIAPNICEEIYKIKKFHDEKNSKEQIILYNREFRDEDILAAEIIIAATDNKLLNSHISEVCKRNNKMVNVVDVKEECSFVFPAIIKNQELVVSIATGGNSPAMAAKIKRDIEKYIPEYYGELIEVLGEQREYIKKEVPNTEYRKQVYNELIALAQLYGRNITTEEIENIISKYKV
ncbi:siroheme synthase [Clostridium homopropionicum DSM 5847]|uniref:precorrin-2 dehydrogenase n=1 Tax=Clostridium homopropionicum DSM 5847 TaxID=1121318 RepID=A0A0L6ZCN0_9CLOT|nr:bifunctional precorrin-2 dehydrogenase/sirohydrochlorin ferrochelatase [Clostridium homopropionicum]KOA20697.1 siroheme synthase [Clostridium homopropionicum DSM 5847]SFF91240.1 precorrin-2 dehydrogenase / sirohydrochlorin ferrochelatase [Clostridium homopropionicum]